MDGSSDWYAVLVVEMGPTAAVFGSPNHSYTQALLSAIPVPDPTAKRQRIDFDESAIDTNAVLCPVGEGHWAAVDGRRTQL